jgi:tungstate transport system ATP-binding protein
LPDSDEPILEAAWLEKTYLDRTVVDVDHLVVRRGEILVILGPSGSGKSVLLRMFNLLEAPTAGTITFDGREAQGLSGHERAAVCRRMAMIFQVPLLFRGTVEQNVGYGLKVRRVLSAQRADPVREMLKVVGLSELADSQVTTLSGGEAQRVSVARALVLKPDILFLDEPFANLDVPTRRSLQVELREILHQRGMTAVFVTHDQEEAARLGDRILVLHEGRIAQEGSARDIFYEPENEFVARFVGVDNIYSGEVVASDGSGLARVSVGGSIFEVLTGGGVGEKVTLGLRPEDVTLLPADEAGAPASSRNVFAGKVTGVELKGPMVSVNLECPFPLEALITRRSYEEMGIEVGKELGARFKTVAVVVIGPG